MNPAIAEVDEHYSLEVKHTTENRLTALPAHSLKLEK